MKNPIVEALQVKVAQLKRDQQNLRDRIDELEATNARIRAERDQLQQAIRRAGRDPREFVK